MGIIAGNQLATMQSANFAQISNSLICAQGPSIRWQSGQPLSAPSILVSRAPVTHAAYTRYLEGLENLRFALIATHPFSGAERLIAFGSGKKEVRSAVKAVPLSRYFPDIGGNVLRGGFRLFDSFRVTEIDDGARVSEMASPEDAVVNMTWDQAFVFAAAHGARLPFETEWVNAMREIGVPENSSDDEDEIGTIHEFMQDWHLDPVEYPVERSLNEINGRKRVRGSMTSEDPLGEESRLRHIDMMNRSLDLGFRLAVERKP